MRYLDFSRAEFVFDQMKKEHPKYYSERYFPKKVHFTERNLEMTVDDPMDKIKQYMFMCFPETIKAGNCRGIELVESINRRVVEESEDGTKAVLYILSTHGGTADLLAYLFEYQKAV